MNIIKWKAIQKTAGIIAIVAVIGISMAACDSGSKDSGPSLNGTWEGSGLIINVSGSTGTVRTFVSLGTLWQSAYDQGYIYTGMEIWRNLNNTDTYTWSGQVRLVSYNTSRPGFATGTSWTNATFTLNGSTLSIRGTPSGGSSLNETYTRR